MSKEDYTKLPDNLPQPYDDGSADHLLGRQIPSLTLPSTKDYFLNFSNISEKYCVLYFFPMMGIPGKELPSGWDDIPGVRGCTPQNISFAKHYADLKKHDAFAIGVSSQSISELEQLSSLRKLPHAIASDAKLEFQKNLNLPTFDFDGHTMYQRLTLVVQNSKIIKVFFPVFPPHTHIFEILEWLENKNRD